MSQQEPIITKYILFDTNIIWSFIDAVNQDEEQYKDLLDDLEKFVNYKKYSLYVSDSIKKELGQIIDIRDFDRFFQEKRLSNAYINFLKIEHGHPLIKVLQSRFKGNIDLSTGVRKPEEADHTLIINGVELLKNREQACPVIIYSNDHEVEDVIKDLENILPREYKHTANYISWEAGFQLIAEMYQYKHPLELKSDLQKILEIVTKKYNALREHTPNRLQAIDLLIQSLTESSHSIEDIAKKNINLENKILELILKYGEGYDTLKVIQKEQESNQVNNKLLVKATEVLHSDGPEKAIELLTSQELKNYVSLFRTYHEIVHNKENKLLRYYRDWNKVITSKKTYVNKEIERQYDKRVFLSIVEQELELFRNNKLVEAHNVAIQLMALLTEVQWNKEDESKKLELYYIMGLYLALARNDIEEYQEIIEILEVTVSEKISEHDTLKNHIDLAKLLLNLTVDIELNNQFKRGLINNIKQFYYARRWNIIWNILLPVWKILQENEQQELLEVLENTYWITLAPPERLAELWENIDKENEIVKGVNLGASLLDKEQEQIVKGNVPDFLKGEHIVIDTRMVGRANVIIHVKAKNSRFGLSITNENIDLSNAQTIEFTNKSIHSFIKGLKTYETRHKLSGIIVLNKEPELNITERKNDLSNIIL